MIVIREVHSEDRREAAADVIRWGYPRPLLWQEWSEGHWITDSERTAYAWIVKGATEGHWMLHAMIQPGCALRILRHHACELLYYLRCLAMLAGATRLYVCAPRDSLRKWLLGCGFFDNQDPIGPYMSLGG